MKRAPHSSSTDPHSEQMGRAVRAGAAFVGLDTFDVRFPTSRVLDGSDAMNPDPDYSAAYVVLSTDAGDGLAGHGFCFTIGRGTEVVTRALQALAPYVIGQSVEAILSDLGGFARRLNRDSQLRWLGPEKGVMHMAAGAIVNACWDLAAKRASKPLWRLLAGLSPRELVALIDFRYITDALTPTEALGILQQAEAGRAEREGELLRCGYPAYTTTPGWLGYDDAKLAKLSADAVAMGFPMVKLKVGANLADDMRRMAIAREAVGPDVQIAIDANQRWNVSEATAWLSQLAEFGPWWIEEPTCPDDILGHAAIREAVAPMRVATGEHVANRVVFKQLLQANALDVVQIDACRVGGVNENLAILLLAAKFGVPVCPHAGGVGLCEAVQHLSMFDYVAISGSMTGRMIEYVDHLHEHFVDPVRVENGRYMPPTAPGASTEMRAESRANYIYPDGPAWLPV